jgi:hypothetical protein
LTSLLDGGHASALRFKENQRHSQSASHTPFSGYLRTPSSSLGPIGRRLALEHSGPPRAAPVSATVTPVVVSGVTTTVMSGERTD